MFPIIGNTILSSSVIFLASTGFALVYRTAGFFNFAHGALITVGAYCCLVLAVWLGCPFVFALPLAVLTTALAGGGLELAIYCPLRSRNGLGLAFLLTSLGIYVVIQNTLCIIFGDRVQTLYVASMANKIIILNASVTRIQLYTIMMAITTAVILGAFLGFTRIGRSISALAADRDLACACGIRTGSILVGTAALSGGLAGLAGILVALDMDMNPTMGMDILLPAVVAVMAGGGGRSIWGLAIASLFVGGAMQAGAWYYGAQWQQPFVFVLLLAFLLVFGKQAARLVGAGHSSSRE